MEQKIEKAGNNDILMTFDVLKKKKLEEIKKNEQKSIVEFIKENKKNLTKGLRKFLDTTDELNDDFINDKLSEYNAKTLIKEISKSRENCYLGLYKLNEIERNLKICKLDEFWDWADTVTSVNPFVLQNKQLDLIISNSLDEVSEKISDTNFELLLKIIENNASVGSLKVFSKLIAGLKAEFLDIEIREKKEGFLFGIGKEKETEFIKAKESDRQIIVRKTSRIFETLNHIIEHHYHNNSFKFYLEMNPEEIEEICRLAKSIKSEELSVNWLESLMRNLVTYYVACAKEFSATADIESLCDNWKLGKIFEIVYDYSSDNELQGKILDSFSIDNSYLPYLPISIIESTFNQEDEKKQKNIIFYLKNRYEIANEKEKRIIMGINEKIIFDVSKNIELCEEAFNWFVEKVEDKEIWCQKISTELLKRSINSDFEMSLSFTRIIRKCIETIKNKENIRNSLTDYVAYGRNKELIDIFRENVITDSADESKSFENLQELIEKIIDSENEEKLPELCKTLKKLYVSNSLNSMIGRKGIDYLCRKYPSSNSKDDILDFIILVIADDKPNDMKNLFFGQFLLALCETYRIEPEKQVGKSICSMLEKSDSSADKAKFLREVFHALSENTDCEKKFLLEHKTELFSEEKDSNCKLLFLHEFFTNHVSETSLLDLQEFIDFVWNCRKAQPSTVCAILEAICEMNNSELIKYTLLKGWKKTD